jgi:S1-C subfamily serine protease
LRGVEVFECCVGSTVEIAAIGWVFQDGQVAEGPWEGSGVLINEAGWVATNFHVVRRATAMQAKVSSTGAMYDVKRLLFRDAARDLAIIELDAQGGGFREAWVGPLEELRIGQDVYSISNAEGGGPEHQPGVINALRPATLGGRTSTVIQHSAVIEHGSSGGGLFDDRGMLVGVNFGKDVEREQCGYAMPAEYVETLQSRAFRVDAPLAEYFDPDVENLERHLTRFNEAEAVVAPSSATGGPIVLEEGVDYIVAAGGQGAVAVRVSTRVSDGGFLAVQLVVGEGRSDAGGVALAVFTAPATREYVVEVANLAPTPQRVEIVVDMVDW